MSVIQFDNGMKVQFDGVPTPQDIEEVARSLGISQQQPQQPQESALHRLGRITGFTRDSNIPIMGGIKNLAETAKGIAKPFVQAGATAVRGIQATPDVIRSIGGDQAAGARADQTMARPANIPGFGQLNTFAGQTPLQNVGSAAQVASNFVGAGRVLPAVLNNAVGKSIATGALQGGLSGAGGYLENAQEPTVGNTLEAAGMGALQGAAMGGLAAKAQPLMMDKSIPGMYQEARAQRLARGQNQILQSQLKSVDSIIDEAVNKAIKPSTSGKNNVTQINNYTKQYRDGVKTIIENRDALQLTDADGNPVEGLPKDLYQTAQAIQQTRKNIYSKYNEMATKATGEGVKFNPDPILVEMKKQANNIANTPAERQYIESLMTEVEELRGQSPDVVQQRIEKYNSSSTVQAYFAGRAEGAKAKVDVSLAGAIRKELDAMIESSSGPGYQELRNQYRSLKTLEKDVAKRVVVDARKGNKGFFDLPDIFGSGDVVLGILSGNPGFVARGLAVKGLSAYAKNLNNPNKILGDMFQKLGDIYDLAEHAGVQMRTDPQSKLSSVEKYLYTVERGDTIESVVEPQKLEYFVPNNNKPIKVSDYQNPDFPRYITPDQIKSEIRKLEAKKNAGKAFDIKKPSYSSIRKLNEPGSKTRYVPIKQR